MGLITIVGGRESNSYCTLKEGAVFIALLGVDLTAWENLEQAQQEFCFVLAAQAMHYFPWTGRRAYCGQALDFPRTSQDNVTVYPEEIKQAQAQIAFNVIFRALQALANQPSEGATTDLSKVRQVSLGGLLSVSFDNMAAKGGTIMDMLTRSLQFPIYMAVTRWVSQFRGGVVGDAEEETCSTTTTSTSTTTSSTTSTTTTTT